MDAAQALRLRGLTRDQRIALLPEPSDEEKHAARNAAALRAAEEELRMREQRFCVLSVGTPVRTDIYGFRGLEARVVRDDGPALHRDRKVTIEKVAGRNAGETAVVSRDRVKPVSGF